MDELALYNLAQNPPPGYRHATDKEFAEGMRLFGGFLAALFLLAYWNDLTHLLASAFGALTKLLYL